MQGESNLFDVQSHNVDSTNKSCQNYRKVDAYVPKMPVSKLGVGRRKRNLAMNNWEGGSGEVKNFKHTSDMWISLAKVPAGTGSNPAA